MDDVQFLISKLLHPNLLTVNELTEILQSYCITAESNLSKDELVDIFKRVAMPLPQRTYGQSRRERLLEKKRSKRKITIEAECSESKIMKVSTVHSERKPPTDRLKPPPSTSVKSVDSFGPQKKIISLSSTTSQSDKMGPIDDSPPVNGKHKRIRIDFSDASEKSTPTPRVVSSKRVSK